MSLAPHSAHFVLIIEELHVCGGESEDVGSEGDEPHVEGDAEENDGEEDTKQTKFAKSHRSLKKYSTELI